MYEDELKLTPIIHEVSEKYNEDVHLVKAIIRVESNFKPNAVSKNGSCKGAMQLSKSTAKKFGVSNVFNAQQNIEGGVRYLSHLRSIFGDDLFRVVASYNVGEGKVYRKSIPNDAKEYANLVFVFRDKYKQRDKKTETKTDVPED
jgi:soluble lytic murein transglycosylase-like protein